MNMNMQSVMKAAAIGAIVNGILAILGNGILYVAPTVGIISSVFLCCGGFLIPIATGALYGYFTPGKETLQQAALGGGVSGVVAGIAYGVLNSIMVLVFALVNGLEIADAVTASTGTLVGGCCGAVIFGFILGAVGGAIWSAVQKDK
jgi:hypothetical protein